MWFTLGNKDPGYQKGRDSTLLPSDSDSEDNKKKTKWKSSIGSYCPKFKPKSDSETSSDETDIMARFKDFPSSREDTFSEEEDNKDNKPKSPKDPGTDKDSDDHPDNSKDDSEPKTKDSERDSEYGSKSWSGDESDNSFKGAQQIEEELSYINELQSQVAMQQLQLHYRTPQHH